MQTHHAKHQRKLKLPSQQWSKQCNQRGAFLPPLPSESHLRWPQAQICSETAITTLQSHWALSSLSSQAECSQQFLNADQFCQVLNRSLFSPTSLYPPVLIVLYPREKLLYHPGINELCRLSKGCHSGAALPSWGGISSVERSATDPPSGGQDFSLSCKAEQEVAAPHQQRVTASLSPHWGHKSRAQVSGGCLSPLSRFHQDVSAPSLDRPLLHAKCLPTVLMSTCKDVGCSCFDSWAYHRKLIAIFQESILSNSGSFFSNKVS